MLALQGGEASYHVHWLPVGGKPRSKAFWNLVVEKFDKKLSLLKKWYLSLGGRITLIKACMSNLLVYYMFLFRLHKLVNAKLDDSKEFLMGKVKARGRKFIR